MITTRWTKIYVPYLRDEPPCATLYDPDAPPENVIIDTLACHTNKFDKGEFVVPETVIKHIQERKFKYVGDK